MKRAFGMTDGSLAGASRRASTYGPMVLLGRATPEAALMETDPTTGAEGANRGSMEVGGEASASALQVDRPAERGWESQPR